MKKALRLWVALLTGAYLVLPDVQAQRVTPAGTLPAVMPSISDLQPPSFRQQRLETVEAKPVTTSVVGGPVAGKPTAAPTVGNQTLTIGGTTNLIYIASLSVTNDGGSPITAFRYITLPDPAVAELYAYNSATGATRLITAVPDEVPVSQYDRVAIRPVANATATTNFQWRARNSSNDLSASATFTINVQQTPVAAVLVSQIVPAGAPATTLTEPLSVEPGSIAATDFAILTVPSTTQGVLALNGTAITAGQIITAAQASQLTFDPAAGFFGTAVFSYRGRNANGTPGTTATYGIPVAKAVCGQASTLNFANLTNGQDFQTTQSILIEGVTVTASNYTAPSGQTTLRVEDNQSLPGKSLAWTADYTSSSNASSSVDFTFSRPLDNFSLALADIDQVNGVWRDQLQLNGYTASGQVISLSASDVALAPNNSNNFSTPNTITGQGNANNFGPNSNVVVTFPQPIVRLQLTYRNAEGVADPGGQLIGINSMSWCSVVDVYTRFTAGPVAANVGNTVSYTVEYGNNGPDAAQQVTRTVTLPVGATNVTVPTGATYDATTRTIDFGTAASVASGSPSSFTFSFTVPTATGAYSLVANTSTPGNENGATANNTATRNLTVSDCNQVSALNYTTTTATGDRRAATETIGGTTLTYTGYTAVSAGTNVFSVGTNTGVLQGQTLVWTLNTTTVAGNATVTLLFNRLVDNLTLNLQDIDRDIVNTNFIDNLRLDGYSTETGGTAVALTASNFTFGAANGFVSPNTARGTATAAAGDAAGNLTVRFTTPIRRLVLTYSNASTSLTGAREQNLGINSISFCAQADLATTVTPQTTPINAGTQGQFNVTFTNAGPDASNNVVRQVQLPAGLTGVTATNGGSYNPTTGVVTYPTLASLASGASQNSTITFTAPANATSVTAAAIISGDASEGGNTANNSASGTVVVNPVADVTTVINGPTSLLAGQPSGTYTVTYSNTGLSSASAVGQTVTLPAGATNVVIPNGATYNPTTRVIDFGTAATLAAGRSNSYQFSFTTPTTPGAVNLVSNTSTTTGQGANTAPDRFTLPLDVQAVADVAVALTAAASPVTAGAQGQFTAVFSNNGPNTATNVTRQVQLPAGLTDVSLPDGGSYDATTGLVTFPTLPTLASGASNSFRILFTTPTTGSGVTATASIATPDVELGQTTNNTATATIALTPVFDLVTRITGPTSTVAGTLTTFSVITQNNGPSVAAGAVQTVQLPAGLTGVYVSNNGSYDSQSGVVTFPAIPTLNSGASQNNTVSFLAPAAGFTATANVTPTSGDSNTGNNSATAAATTITPVPTTSANLFTTISPSATSVAPGGAVTYTITQGNDGLNPATNVVTSVSLPAGLTGVTVSGGGTYNSTTGVVTFPVIGTQNAGSSTSYTVTVNAPATGTIMAGASVSSGTPDPMPANNIATANVRVNPVTDVATTLSGPTVATAGQAVTYTVTTSNAGSTAAANVQQTVQIPAGLTGVTVSGGGTYNSATGVVTFPVITAQLPGASTTNTITYTTPASGTLSNVASVTTATAEAITTNNRSAVTTAVTPVADLAVSLTGPGTAVAGNPVVYSVTTTNNGTSTAQNSTTTVQLPTGLTGVVVSGGGTYNPTTGLVTFPVITSQPAGSVTNTISFVAPTSTQLVVAANTAADNEEVTTNNSATAVTTVTAPTTQTVDVVTTLSANNTTRTPGQPVTFTVTATNGAGSATATNVQPVLYLPAGLTGVVLPTGATYNSTTGIVTLPVTASLAAGAAVPYSITVNAPASGSFTALAFASADQTETNTANNSASSTITVNPQADVVTTVTGPSSISPGAAATYNVVTLNNGPSAAAGVQQTVQLPANLTNVVVSGGGTYSSGTGLVTFPAISALQPGSANAVTNTISFTAPTTAFAAVGSVTTITAETNTGNNTSTQNTTLTNQPPTAIAVVSTQPAPMGNSAGAMPLSALLGRDADGRVSSYTITSLPPAAQGVLYYQGNPVTLGQNIPAADAALLTFDPVAGYVGNVFFTFTATDDGNAVSPVAALYTIPVGQDVNSVYTNSPVKGGTVATSYQNNDPIATVFDVNGGKYSSAGAITANGLTNATTNTAGTNQLASLGLQLNPTTGLISVQDRSKLRAGTYTVQVTTIDAFGGTNTQPVTFTIGVAPLPVTLVSFTAKAVGVNALLTWSTAQELNNSHFVVERSLNGQEFTAIEQVKGQGTKATTTPYSFTDEAIGRNVNGTVYYRLRQVDLDGTSSLSSVQTVAFSSALQADVTVYPNPATDHTATYLDLTGMPAGKYAVTITDMAGRVVRTFSSTGGTQQTLDIVGLPKGSYSVQVQGNGQVITKRLTKAE